MNARLTDYARPFEFIIVAGWRDQEMEIGYPTDVKHVAHIGWDGPSVGGPNWVCDI